MTDEEKKAIETIEELKNADLTTVYLNGFYDGEKKVKDKIKAKIEVLDKQEEDLQNSIRDEEREEYSDASISWELMDIHTRREVLQSLLRKKFPVTITKEELEKRWKV